MPITPAEAADVAKEHGLSLADARALAAMADSTDEAKALAAKFRPEPDEPDERAAAQKLAAEIDGPDL